MSRLRPILALGFCALFLPVLAQAALPPNLQLGSLCLDDQGRGLAVAVPLDASLAEVRLLDDSTVLSLEERDGSAWLVASPQARGAFSALLEWKSGGEVRRAVVAGEVRDAEPSLLLVADQGTVRRGVRMIGMAPVESVGIAGARATVTAPDSEGWQIVEVSPAAGRAELRGSLRLADATSIPAQVSLAEVVSVLGSTPLTAAVRWTDVIPLRERIGGRELRARLALRGRYQGRRLVALRDLYSNANGVRFQSLGHILLPGPPENLSSGAFGLRLPDPALLYLAGREARLVGPRQGILDVETFTGLRFERAVVSPLDPSTLFAVRRNGQGRLRLARWSVGYEGGAPQVRPRLLGRPLREIFGFRDMVLHDLRARPRFDDFPQLPVRERVMLLASPIEPGTQTLRPRVLGLRLDFRRHQPIGARVLWKSGPSIPAGGTDPRMTVLPSLRPGSAGYPLGVRVDYPDLRSGRRIVRARAGERFQLRYAVGRSSSRFLTVGAPLSPRRYLGADTDGENTYLRRFVRGNQEPSLGASGILQGVRPLGLRASSLRSRAYLLSESANGRALRLLDIGLPSGTNLPPRVDAGPDVRVRAASRDGARVRLNALVEDANGDPLGFRWIGRGVRFRDARSPQTEAVIPPGVTQVRARVRERAKAVSYEVSDVRTFTVDVATSAPDTPGLATKLVSIAPNPANPRVRVSFTLAQTGAVRVRIVDARGRVVRRLLDERRTLGAHELVWDGADDTGAAAASGVYFVQLQADGTLDTRRVALVR